MNTNTNVNMNLNTRQLEMTFSEANPYRRPRIAHERRRRAQWWFNQMRDVVDRALDWQPAAAPRPEQTHLTFAPAR